MVGEVVVVEIMDLEVRKVRVSMKVRNDMKESHHLRWWMVVGDPGCLVKDGWNRISFVLLLFIVCVLCV